MRVRSYEVSQMKDNTVAGFVDVVHTWAARPKRESEVSGGLTDAKGRVAKITLNCSDASVDFPRVSINSLLSF